MGRVGCGKTTLLRQLLRRRTRPAVVVSFDESMEKEFPPQRRFLTARPFLEYLLDRGQISIGEPVLLSPSTPEEFSALCRACIAHGGLLLMVDEIDMFDSANGKRDAYFHRMIHYGRHDYGGKIDLVTASRRPYRISRDLRSQTREWFIFQTTDSRDREALGDAHPSIPDRAPLLPPFTFLRVTSDGVTEGRVSPS